MGGEGLVKRRKFFLRFIFIMMIFRTHLVWAIPMLLPDYALPDNNIRAKLSSLFRVDYPATAYVDDKTWIDFGSWHWSIGQLATDDNTKFVVKAAKYHANIPIVTSQYPGIIQIHTPQQNISRIERSRQAEEIITAHQLGKIKIPACWVYPISGNNSDLCKPDITDHQVIIVEEMIKRKSENLAWCPYVTDYVQEDVLQLDPETFHQLVTFARRGQFLDLSPKNLLVDQADNLVVIDLEDRFAHQRKEGENAHALLRPLKRFKLQCRQEGATMYGIGLTGVSNTRYAAVRKEGQRLINKSICTLSLKRNVFEIGAIALVLIGALMVMMCYMSGRGKIYADIKKCRMQIKRLIKSEQIKRERISPEAYQEIVHRAVKRIMPYENRETIFNAFATIAIADTMKRQQEVRILGREFDSPQQARKESLQRINSIWRSDRSTYSRTDTIKMMAENKSIGISVAW